MEKWHELFNKENEPSKEQIGDFIDTALWADLEKHLLDEYNVKPKIAYSSCAMDAGFWKGWNIKYKKSGKSLCTVYPKQGHFVALITIGIKEATEAELKMPTFSEYVKDLYKNAVTAHDGGRYLAIEVSNEEILHDLESLVSVRVNTLKQK